MLREELKAGKKRKEGDPSGKMYSSRICSQCLIIRLEVCYRSNGRSSRISQFFMANRETYSHETVSCGSICLISLSSGTIENDESASWQMSRWADRYRRVGVLALLIILRKTYRGTFFARRMRQMDGRADVK